jgi:hypothetical protein
MKLSFTFIALLFFSSLYAQVEPKVDVPLDSVIVPLDTIVIVVDTVQKKAAEQGDVMPESAREAKKDTTTQWKKRANYNLNFSQAGFRNWIGGGQNSIAISAITSMTLTKEDSFSSFVNQLDASFGITKQGDTQGFRKTDDNIILRSKYGVKLRNDWKISAMLDGRTQIRPGYRYERIPNTDAERRLFISEFLAPGFFLVSIGAEYSVKDFYTVRLAPLTGKVTLVLNDSLSRAGTYKVEPGRKLRNELGAQFNGSYRRTLMKNVTLQTNILLFSNYEEFGDVDVNFEGLLMLRVNKYISSSISAQMIYDDDIDIVREDGTTGPALQIKQVINVGFILQL